MAANLSYPTIVPSAPVGNGVGLPQAPDVVPWNRQFSDQSIRGGLKINPAFAPYFYGGRFSPEFPVPSSGEPVGKVSKAASVAQATVGAPGFRKDRPASRFNPQVLWGNRPPQPLVKVPWVKKFIPPLSLFNDASQWVNRLMFNAPMTRWGFNSSIFPLKAQYFTPRPIDTTNLAAGTLNLQLQLGQTAIQGAQLTLAASNYFGGS